MSENVAYCLEYLNKEGTEQTWLFIRMVDTFFGYLNVKSTLTVKTKLKPSRELYRSSSDARFKVCLIKHKCICNVTNYFLSFMQWLSGGHLDEWEQEIASIPGLKKSEQRITGTYMTSF